jgi:hypothetical protein
LSPFVPLTRERALENAGRFRIVATKKPKGGARWRRRTRRRRMRWKGEYDDPPFATHGENIGVHTFLWSDGQMTMVSWGAQQKEIKVLAVCVCACTTPTQCPAFREPKRTTIVWNVQGIYTSSSGIALISGARIEMFSP